MDTYTYVSDTSTSTSTVGEYWTGPTRMHAHQRSPVIFAALEAQQVAVTAAATAAAAGQHGSLSGS